MIIVIHLLTYILITPKYIYANLTMVEHKIMLYECILSLTNQNKITERERDVFGNPKAVRLAAMAQNSETYGSGVTENGKRLLNETTII